MGPYYVRTSRKKTDDLIRIAEGLAAHINNIQIYISFYLVAGIGFEPMAWVRGHWTDVLNSPGFSTGYKGQIPGVCLGRGSAGGRLGDRQHLLGH